MKLWSGYRQAPFADNTKNCNDSRRSMNTNLAGKMSTKRVFFAILLLAVVAITTKAMQSAATSDASTTRTKARAMAAAEPLVFGMEEPWGNGSWGYPKAGERAIKTPRKAALSRNLDSLSASAVVNTNPPKVTGTIVGRSFLSDIGEGLRSTWSKFFAHDGVRLRGRGSGSC